MITTGCASRDGVMCCRSAESAVFASGCENTTAVLAAVPCRVRWAITSSMASSACAVQGGAASAALTWQPVVDGVVDARAAVAAFITTSPISLLTVYSQAVDGAGNADAVHTYSWWSDAMPPLAPAITKGPDKITVSTAATFVIVLPTSDVSPGWLALLRRGRGLAAMRPSTAAGHFPWSNGQSGLPRCVCPGQMTFVYTIVSGNETFTVSGGNPPIPDPTPVNTAPSTLTINGFSPGAVYSLTVWSVSQAGMTSANGTTFTWHVLASAPSMKARGVREADVPRLCCARVYTAQSSG